MFLEGAKMKSKTPKFRIQDLLTIGIVFVVVGVALAYGADVVSDVRDDFTDTASYQYNTSTNALKALDKLSGKLPTIATIAAAAIIIGVIVVYMYLRFAGGKGGMGGV